MAFVVFPYTPTGLGPIRLRPVWVWTGDKLKPPKRLFDILRKALSQPPHWLGRHHLTCLNIKRGQCLTFPPEGFLVAMPPYFSGVSPTDHRYALTHVIPSAPERTGPVEMCRKCSWSQKSSLDKLWDKWKDKIWKMSGTLLVTLSLCMLWDGMARKGRNSQCKGLEFKIF